MPQQGLRETTDSVRGRTGSAVRASWATISRGLILAPVIGLFLAVIGVTTHVEGAIWYRAFYFTLIAVAATVMVNLIVSVMVRGKAVPPRRWLVTLAVILIMTPGMGLFVFLGDTVFGQSRPGLDELPIYLANSLAFSGFVSLVLWFTNRTPPIVDILTSELVAPSRFLERLPAKLTGAEVWAVEAEDHYLRLHTSKGSDLILLRLSDAMAELDGLEGAQTHRSWWVARAAIRDIKRADGRATLTLPDGKEAPVSRAHAKALRERGWI